MMHTKESRHDGSAEDCPICRVVRVVDQVAGDILPEVRPREARWRYFGPRGALGQHPASVYFWTTEKVGNRYQSGIYRYIKSKKLWRPSELRRHARRVDAMARALALWDAKKEVAQ